ncbi:MAG: glycoside hydrolase family 1 protein [Proteobacteria bacterium]|nr:glycoside hydrolase family 1 protein [Pseudomonadota bacterium]
MRIARYTLLVIGLLTLAGAVALAVLTPDRTAQTRTAGPTDRRLEFPAKFYWGAALAGHQAETRQASDWGAFEAEVERNGRFDHGREFGTTLPGHIRDFGAWPETVRRQKAAFDSHYEEDVAAAADMGLNALRTSIEWARLFPRASQTEPDPAGLAYYDRLFATMRAHGITPFVTLFHYVAPAWFFEPDAAGRRGWERADALAHWERFVRAVATRYVPAVRHFCTLNEPMVYLYSGYIDGVYPPLEHRPDAAATADVYAALLAAHALAYRVLHEAAATRGAIVEVGITQATQAFAPLRNWHPADRAIAALVTQAWNWDFLDAIDSGRMRIAATGIDRPIPGLAGTQDYVGINYYTRIYIEGHLLDPTHPDVRYRDPARPAEPVNDMGWTIYPHGLYEVLRGAGRRYGRPVYILENGDSDRALDDRGRQDYLAAHIRETWLAIEAGVDVRSYVVWSLIDNFEWVDGFDARLGLIAVDYRDGFRRTPRGSVAMLREITRGNALPARLAGR